MHLWLQAVYLSWFISESQKLWDSAAFEELGIPGHYSKGQFWAERIALWTGTDFLISAPFLFAFVARGSLVNSYLGVSFGTIIKWHRCDRLFFPNLEFPNFCFGNVSDKSAWCFRAHSILLSKKLYQAFLITQLSSVVVNMQVGWHVQYIRCFGSWSHVPIGLDFGFFQRMDRKAVSVSVQLRPFKPLSIHIMVRMHCAAGNFDSMGSARSILGAQFSASSFLVIFCIALLGNVYFPDQHHNGT